MILSDRGRACLLGAAVGDACGVTLEFKAKVTREEALKAMRYPGGGPHGVGRGQVSDDTELAVCLYTVLSSTRDAEFPADAVAAAYCAWMLSGPFDSGRTCSLAFSLGTGEPVKTADKMRADAASFSMQSQSNGALMRSSPIAVWGVCRGLSTLAIADVARQDARLSHPSPQCVESNAAYCAMLAHLLRAPGDTDGALNAAKTACRHPDVMGWLSTDDPGSVTVNSGHVKHGIVLTVKHLRARSPFKDAMYDVLRRGGDTDTNGAIVGAAMGAFHGVIPEDLLKPVVDFDCTLAPGEDYSHQQRPAWLSPKCFLDSTTKNDPRTV